MADREFVAYNPDTNPKSLETPQAGNRYIAKRAVHLEAALTTDSTIDGQDVAAIGAKVAHLTVSQPVNLDTMESRIDALTAVVVLKGAWDASAGVFPASTLSGESWICSVAGMVGGVDFALNDRVIALVNAASATVYTGQWLKQAYTDVVLSVAGKVGAVVLTEADISDLQVYLLVTDIDTLAKLNAILSDATLGDASDFATAAQGVLAATALQTTSIDTLAKLNAIVGDTDVVGTADPRLSDARTPLTHSHIDAVNTPVVAYAGGGQANAVELVEGINIVTTVATEDDSVKLPDIAIGKELLTVNHGANKAMLFPNTSSAIEYQAVNSGIPIVPKGQIYLKRIDAINWIQI